MRTGMGASTLLLLACASILVGCGDEPSLGVDLKTDFAPGIEFAAVRVTIEGRSTEVPALRTHDYLAGRRVADRSGLGGRALVEVALLAADGTELASRPSRVTVSGHTVITVVITRDCRGISCSDPGAPACLGGRCVPADCDPSHPERCGGMASECSGDAECPAGAACAVARCTDGVCLYGSSAGACGVNEWCHPEDGCTSISGGDPDGGAAMCRTDADCDEGEICTTEAGCLAATRCDAASGCADTDGDPCTRETCELDLDPSRCGSSAEPDGSACVLATASGTCHGGRCCTGCWDGATCAAGDEACAGATGTCRLGGGAPVCCTGCWDGTMCQIGDTVGACGAGGTACGACACATDRCMGGACVPPAGRAAAVFSGGVASHACSIALDGSLSCWGRNDSGQVGAGDVSPSRPVPALVDSGSWTTVSPGGSHTCGIRAGELHCWGDNSRAQLGIGTISGAVPMPARVGTASNWRAVAAGFHHTCALNTLDELWCWGRHDAGQLGTGMADLGDQPRPVRVGTDTDWALLSAGGHHTCAVKRSGTLWCWGSNATSQLGLGDGAHRYLPVRVGPDSDWRTVGAGGFHPDGPISEGSTCAIKTGGTLWCWGGNTSGWLGLGDRMRRSFPVQVGADADWTRVALAHAYGAGARGHTCALKTDGSLWCWGSNTEGELGLGDTTDRTSRVRVGTRVDYTDLAVGLEFTCARRADAILECWGGNGWGALATGDGASRSSPTRVCF